jgi:hypothetical protein
MFTNCNFWKDCKAPLCPMVSREQNLEEMWQVSMPVCSLDMNVPFWVKQQRKIFSQIKYINSFTCFNLLMLEAPLKITSNVKGIHLEPGYVNSYIIQWFMNNQLIVPYEIEDHDYQNLQPKIINMEELKGEKDPNKNLKPKIISLEELKGEKDPTIN